MHRRRAPATRPTIFTHTTREAARVVFLHGLWPSALAIWARGGQSHRAEARGRALERRSC